MSGSPAATSPITVSGMPVAVRSPAARAEAAAGSQVSEQLIVLAAPRRPIDRDPGRRPGPPRERPVTSAIARAMIVRAYPALAADVAQVGGETVRAIHERVDGRLLAEPTPLGDPRPRSAMRAGDVLQGIRADGASRAGARVAFERREAGRRAAETACHRDGISRPRHRAEPRRPRVLTEERHADHPTPARGRGVPTDDGDAMRSRGVAHPRVEGVHVLRLGRGGEGEGDQRPSRIAAHRGDVGEIDGEGLPADVVEAWPTRAGSARPPRSGRSSRAGRHHARTSSTAVSSPIPVLMPVPSEPPDSRSRRINPSSPSCSTLGIRDIPRQHELGRGGRAQPPRTRRVGVAHHAVVRRSRPSSS